MRAVLENEFLRSRVCMVCMEAQGLVKCIHCGMKILCTQCDDEEHKKNPLHDREIFHDGFFKPVLGELAVFAGLLFSKIYKAFCNLG